MEFYLSTIFGINILKYNILHHFVTHKLSQLYFQIANKVYHFGIKLQYICFKSIQLHVTAGVSGVSGRGSTSDGGTRGAPWSSSSALVPT